MAGVPIKGGEGGCGRHHPKQRQIPHGTKHQFLRFSKVLIEYCNNYPVKIPNISQKNQITENCD